MNYFKAKPVFTILLFFTILFVSTTLSGISFTVVPMKFKLNASPGDTLTNSITVHNSVGDSLTLDIYLRDILFNVDGDGREIEPGNMERGMAEWIVFTPREIDFTGVGSQNIRFTIKVPESISSGDYWANFYVEPTGKSRSSVTTEAKGRKFTLYTVTRYKISLRLRVKGEVIKQGEITDVVFYPNATDTSLIVNTTFENTGDIILRCNGRIEIRDEMGEAVKTIGLVGFSTFPECKRIVRTEIPKTLKPGEYSALVVIDFGGEHLVAGEAFFEISEDGRQKTEKNEEK